MDSFMFRVHMAERRISMDEPQGQNRFFERCAQMLLELSDELERNLYIEAILKDYRSSGISVENLKKRSELAMKGTPQSRGFSQNLWEQVKQKKKESAAEKAQKLMLTWLVEIREFLISGKIYFSLQILWYLCIRRWQRCF